MLGELAILLQTLMLGEPTMLLQTLMLFLRETSCIRWSGRQRLAQLWIIRISAQPPSVVQYPEVCKNGDVTVWRIRDFDPDMGLPGDARGLLSPQHSQPGSLDTLIPTDTLKEKFSVSETSRRLHLIFVFRHSNPAGEDHVEEHFWNAMDTAASLSVSLEGDTIETISLYVQRGQGADIYHLLLMTSQWSFIWSLDP
jgi:hypothetical protein